MQLMIVTLLLRRIPSHDPLVHPDRQGLRGKRRGLPLCSGCDPGTVRVNKLTAEPSLKEKERHCCPTGDEISDRTAAEPSPDYQEGKGAPDSQAEAQV